MARGRGRRGGGGGRGRGPPRGRPGEEEEEEEEEEESNWKPRARGPVGQSSTVGMLPPSDSEDEDEEGGEPGDPKAEAAKAAPKPAAAAAVSAPSGQTKKAAQQQDSDSGSDESSDEDESSEDEAPKAKPANYLSQPAVKKDKGKAPERDPEDIRKEMERLELTRQKREQDRLKRVATEGWDRYLPVSDTNRPPGSVPSDHPGLKA